jgi:arylsulfatase A-like enzyme
MSIMTSLYPPSHGVSSETNRRLADEQVTLAELLREGGYRTAAFVDGGWMRALFGFNQGFDSYDDHGGGITKILPKVEKWLDENKANPFFLFMHCYDIHSPYDPPPPYNSIFHDFTYTGSLIPNTKNLEAAAWKGLKVSDQDLQHFVALYDGGIRYTDEKIGEFLSYLQDSGLADQSLIIITSDHGEEFKEHGSLLHWQLYYRPNLHVPLIMHLPNCPGKEIRISELVQSIDLLPTILEIAGLPAHAEAQGRSLIPLIKRNTSFLNRSFRQLFPPSENETVVSFALGPIMFILKRAGIDHSIITDGYQMIYNPKSPAVQLFDLKADPLAHNNIAKDHDEITERLLSQFNDLYRATPNYKASKITPDEETRDQLKALGYIQ